jgi:hypothetical protein
VEEAVAEYGRVVAQRDAATDELGSAEFDGIARRRRVAWKNWQAKIRSTRWPSMCPLRLLLGDVP